jgi:hypothetical protein
LSVLVESLLWLGIGLPVAIALVPALGKGAVDLASVRDAGPLLALTLFGAVVFLVVSAMVVMALARAFVLLTRSVTDLRQRRVVDGIVLRLKENLVVIYDGKDPVAHAVGLPAGAPSLAEGTIVRATLSPRLKHLYKIEIVRPPKRAISEAAPQEEPKPGTEFLVPTDLDWLGDFILTEIRAATGLPFEKSARNAMPVMRMKSASKTPFGVFSFEASGRGRIGLAVAAEDSLVGRRLEDSRLVKALLRPRSVEGIGNWAKWYRGGTLIVQFDESRLAVWVRIKGMPRDKRLEIAQILASKVVDQFRHAHADTKADTT